MDKGQALQSFWSSFGLKAYDDASVPTGDNSPQFPYITYRAVQDVMDNQVAMQASVWYRSTSWEGVETKTKEISQALSDLMPIKLDNGYLWLMRGTPFAQRLADESDDMIKRMYINIVAEYLTAE